MPLFEVLSTQEGGRLGRRGESGTAGTILNTTLLAPGSSLNSYCRRFRMALIRRKWITNRPTLRGWSPKYLEDTPSQTNLAHFSIK